MQAAWLAGELQLPVGLAARAAHDLLLFSFRNHVLGAQIPLGEQEEGGGQVSVEAQARPAPRLKLVLEIISQYIIRIHFKVI